MGNISKCGMVLFAVFVIAALTPPTDSWCIENDGKCKRDSDCCSEDCAFSKCRGSPKQCQEHGRSCTFSTECCSNDCYFSKCAGGGGGGGVSVGGTRKCIKNDAKCTWSSDCCSDNCRFGKCGKSFF